MKTEELYTMIQQKPVILDGATELPNITNAIKNAKQHAIIFFHRFIAVPPLSIDTLFFDNYIIQNSTLYFLILSSQSLPKRKSYFMGFLSAAFTI